MKKIFTILYSLLTVIYSLFTIHCFSQNKTIDSLQQALKNYDAKKLELHKNLLPDESDTTKVNILNELAGQFTSISDLESARKYADEALAIAQQNNYKRGIASSINNIGVVYWNEGNFPDALKNMLSALKIRQETGDKLRIARSYINIGMIYIDLGNYPEALKNSLAALKTFEEIGDKSGTAISYDNIGNIYSYQGNYPEALKNRFASLKISEETGNKRGIAMSYNNVGIIYEDQGNYPAALNNYLAAVKINEESGNKNWLANNYNNIGNIYTRQGNYTEGLKNQFASLKIREEIGDKYGIALSYIGIGNGKLKMHAFNESQEWLLKGLQLGKEMEVVAILTECYTGLAKVDSALGNFKGAYENHKLFILYRDSLINEENTKKITQQQMQYDFDKKEVETKALTDAELKKQKLVRNGFMGGFAVVLLFAGVFFRQRNKIKKEKLRAETALDELKRAQQKLVEKEKLAAIGTVAQRMAHEIQNPLNFVNNFSELSEGLTAELANAETDEERQEIISAMKENMSKINHHGKRADGIIKNLQRHLNEGKGLDLFEK